jgi:hypothetical protein
MIWSLFACINLRSLSSSRAWAPAVIAATAAPAMTGSVGGGSGDGFDEVL